MDIWEMQRGKNMAVHIEFFSVIVPVRAIEERFRGGMAGFKEVCGEPPTTGNWCAWGR